MKFIAKLNGSFSVTPSLRASDVIDLENNFPLWKTNLTGSELQGVDGGARHEYEEQLAGIIKHIIKQRNYTLNGNIAYSDATYHGTYVVTNNEFGVS